MLSTNCTWSYRTSSRPALRSMQLLLIAAIAVLFAGLRLAVAQSFSSGSNGSDGALNLTTPGTILFDPKAFNPPLDPDVVPEA